MILRAAIAPRLMGHSVMQAYVSELIGAAAAVASLYAAYAKTMVPLRAAAVAANVLMIILGVLDTSYALSALGAILLALNAWRLRAMLALTRDIDAATRDALGADWLLPYTHPRRFKAGDIIMKRGDYATAAFFIVSGEVEIVDTGVVLGSGTLLGEIGLFAPDGRRTGTVRCKTDALAAQLDYDRFKELYFQNPEFGFHLLHLIVARLHGNPDMRNSPTLA
jgi:CRP/FNR family cyclic AMP-dependent transcriptional regulator